MKSEKEVKEKIVELQEGFEGLLPGSKDEATLMLVNLLEWVLK